MAHPDAEVVVVTSEASIQMCIQELATCKQHNLPIKILMLNNGFMGMVRQWQEFFYESRYSQSVVEKTPDFIKLAESYGHVGMRIENKEDLEKSMQEAFAMKDQLVFIDVVVDPEENVYPMIEAGKGHNEMYLSPESELV
jgi:acetolactate synthase I/II/III large subunit